VTAPAAPPPEAKPAKRGDPRDVEGLYEKGVEHYARGEYLEASAMFLRILQIDPRTSRRARPWSASRAGA
jgi:hypothetical protein